MPPHFHSACMLANLIPRKGHITFIKAAEKLASEFPKSRYYVIGYGPLQPEIESEIRRSNLSEQVEVLGYRRDAWDILSVMDCLVHPASSEAFGIVQLEAMALGIPVVAAGVGGIPEVTTNGVTGFIVTPHDSESLCKAVGKIFRDHKAAKLMGRMGQMCVAQHFTSSLMASNYLSLYREVLREKRGAALELKAEQQALSGMV